MFTGIVEEVGSVSGFTGSKDSKTLTIKASKVLKNSIVGDSIAVNGVCQTVVSMDSNSFTVDVLEATLTKTTLGKLRLGKKVNLERALTMDRPFGGHIVQGHVQGMGKITGLQRRGKNTFLSIKPSAEILPYLIEEGSVTIDGLSLTIAELKGSIITINLIPHTVGETTAKDYRVGDEVNIEPDILVKTFVKNQSQGLTAEKLKSWGY